MHYYQWHIGDYRRDTSHLTMLEHGAYRQLLDSYYLTESPLPSEECDFMRSHCSRSADEIQAVRNGLKDFFTLTDKGWVHHRCEKELKGLYDKSESARASANLRWQREKERKQAAEKAKTEEVDVSKLNQENKDTIQVDWGASEKGKENAFFQGPTKKVPEAPKQPASSASSQTSISAPNFELGIKILIAIIDFIMSNVLWKIAGEGKSSSYTADPESKKNLQDSLLLVLGESRIKMPPWLVCLFAFLAEMFYR